ncbi:hypothetical protein [Rubrivivax sp. A210]|uniref:hypothetical protein n=1 Tax=Rubrivivax sp. A210 TaxID=2772301 RepID=UPI00191944E0|nr:hypothetical protein [Rubrivivax sp. A210]
MLITHGRWGIRGGVQLGMVDVVPESTLGRDVVGAAVPGRHHGGGALADNATMVALTP